MTKSFAAETVAEQQEIDLTPLIDCFLMLIIFFSCLEFRALEAKLPAFLPRSVGQTGLAAPPERTLRVAIVADAWGSEVPRHPGTAIAGPDLRVHRLVDHKVHWQVGSRHADSPAALDGLLTAHARDASWQMQDPAHKRFELVPIVVEPGAGTTYADVAETVDAARAAGFATIRFGGGTRRR